ncbi:MAG: Rubrerythrin-2, partial [Candidatus Ranarchaeia archaeon]
ESQKKAERTFKWAFEIEKIHKTIYEQALETIKTGKDLPTTDYYVCDICDYTAEGQAPERYPTDAEQFTQDSLR